MVGPSLQKGRRRPNHFCGQPPVFYNKGNETGETETVHAKLTESSVKGTLLGMMYETEHTGEIIAGAINELHEITTGDSEAAATVKARAGFVSTMSKLQKKFAPSQASQMAKLRKKGFEPELPQGSAYASGLESHLQVVCSDGDFPFGVTDSMRQADASANYSPNFGKVWSWGHVPCSEDTWRAHDNSKYYGPFNKKTSAPVLFIGNTYDPATNSTQAEKAAKAMPNAGLILSDSWGHTAYGTSECATKAVDEYLVKGINPGSIKCSGDYQPFTGYGEEERSVVTKVNPVVGFGTAHIAEIIRKDLTK